MGNSCFDIHDPDSISSVALKEFSEKSDLLVQNTNETFRSLDDMSMLIGRCPLEVVLDNHSNHLQTMPL